MLALFLFDWQSHHRPALYHRDSVGHYERRLFRNDRFFTTMPVFLFFFNTFFFPSRLCHICSCPSAPSLWRRNVKELIGHYHKYPPGHVTAVMHKLYNAVFILHCYVLQGHRQVCWVFLSLKVTAHTRLSMWNLKIDYLFIYFLNWLNIFE